MNDNTTYIVKCSEENFEDIHCMVQVFGHIIDVDVQNCCIKTASLDSTMKRRLGDIGASFWEEPVYTVTGSMMRRSA